MPSFTNFRVIQFDLQNQVERHLVRNTNYKTSEAAIHEEETSRNHDEEAGRRQKSLAVYDPLEIEIV